MKDKKFKCFTAATEEAIEALWEQLQKFGPPLGNDMKQPSLKKGTYGQVLNDFNSKPNVLKKKMMLKV